MNDFVTTSVNTAVDTDERWAEVQRVVASRAFNRSPRLSSFLTHVCRKMLEGSTDELTEQQIGIEVFQRAADYNPGDDNIVRSAARQLRQKLSVYYQTEAAPGEIRIEIPKGAYVPVFETVRVGRGEPESVAKTPRGFGVGWLAGAFALGLLVAAVVAGIHEWAPLPGPVHGFWRQVFSPGKKTLIVVGDAGLNIFDNLARREVSLNEYMSGAYFTAPQAATPEGYEWAPLAHRRYTTLADLRLIEQFYRLAEFGPAHAEVRFARDIRIEDLKGNNIVLIGSAVTNPWSELVASGLNFRLGYDGMANTITVSNAHPRAKESASYTWSERDPAHRGYAHIALTKNLDGTGRILLVEGTTMAGVNAAAEFLADERRLAAALASSRSGKFEVLLEGEMMDGSSPASQVIAVR